MFIYGQVEALNKVTNYNFPTDASGWTPTNGDGTDVCGNSTSTTETVFEAFAYSDTVGNPSGSFQSQLNTTSNNVHRRGMITQTFIAPDSGTVKAKGIFDYYATGVSWNATANTSWIRLDLYDSTNATYIGNLGCVSFNSNQTWTTTAWSSDVNLTGGTTYTIRATLKNQNSSTNGINDLHIDNVMVNLAPTGLSASAVAGTKNASLSWTASTGDPGLNATTPYKVYRDTSSPVSTFLANATTNSYTDSSTTGNTTYYFAVTDVDTASTESPKSAEASVLTCPDTPGTPTFSGVTDTSITVNWTAPTGGAASYKVERAPDVSGSPGAWGGIATGVTGLSYTDNSPPLTCNTTYWYRVRATNASGDGAYSGQGSQATSACPLPTVQWTSASQASVNESGTMTITAQLSAASGLDVTVPYTVTGTATGSGTDYTITASPITITAGLTTNTVTITIAADTLDENNETVIVTMGTPTNATQGATTVHTATITDDDAAPTIAFTLASSNGSEATTPANMEVSLSSASGKTITVDYAVTGGTATGGGTDYTLTSGTLTFNPGVTTQNISATIVDDASSESDETIIITISNPTNATLGAQTTHTYTITDNDAAGPPTIEAPTESGYTADYMEPNSGNTTTNTFRFKVKLTSATALSYIRVCIGDNDDTTSYPCYNMTADIGCADPYCNGNNSDGEQYVYGPIGLGAAQDIRFYFEAQNGAGTTKLPSNAPTGYYTGPAVYLLYGSNMVGVPKCLGDGDCTAGATYSSVLGDDSGYSWCRRYNPGTGQYESCTSSNIYTGKGYWIWGRSSNIYRLDEKNSGGSDLAGNVSTLCNGVDQCFDIDLQTGWNVISNPYNKRIPLDAASGSRVNVYNVTTSQEMQYGAAVADTPTPWVSNYVSKYSGSVSGYSPQSINDTPPAVLEPWVGYWIYVNCVDKNTDTFCDTLKLRVYKE